MKILFLIPYPLDESPSQRFRFEQYFEILTAKGHSYKTQSFLSKKNWRIFYLPGKPFQKAGILIGGFLRRVFILMKVPSFDLIFLHREALPIGPPFIEWIIAKVFRKKIIYDFDDAIWLTDRMDESWWVTQVKWRNKVKNICRWSYKISCGNEYLISFARQYSRQVFYNPSTIDTNHHNPELFQHAIKGDSFTIGWTGSHSTLKYLYEIEEALRSIVKKYPAVSILVIADKPPNLSINSLQFVKWSPRTEIESLAIMDIGLMPLPDDPWTRGKCGFKALQYMSMGIPSLVSPVGVNATIVDHGINGFHCRSKEDWKNYLEKLIVEKDLRVRFGWNGRDKVQRYYSVASNAGNFLSLFE